MSMKRYWKWRYIIPAALVLGPIGLALLVVISGGIVMLLWNWVLPPLFDVRPITLWQGFGLLALCRILFGGFGRGGTHSRHMTSEERERFRRRIRGCRGDAAADAQPPATTLDTSAR